MDPKMAAAMALGNPNDVVGFKVAHYMGGSWAPVDRAVQAGKLANMPVMIDFGRHDPPLSLEELFMKHLRPRRYFYAHLHLAGRQCAGNDWGRSQRKSETVCLGSP